MSPQENKQKIILDLCGGTGAWSKPYKDAGYDVRVITLPEYDITDPNVMKMCIDLNPYGILAAPPCTKFSRAAWQIKKKDRDFVEGMKCVRSCYEVIWGVQEKYGAQLSFWALENPDGYLTQFLGACAFYFQPWMFGEKDGRATKRTMLWGYFNSPAKTTRKRTMPFISPHSRHDGKGAVDHLRRNEAWGSMTVEERAATSPGFARAFYQANN